MKLKISQYLLVALFGFISFILTPITSVLFAIVLGSKALGFEIGLEIVPYTLLFAFIIAFFIPLITIHFCNKILRKFPKPIVGKFPNIIIFLSSFGIFIIFIVHAQYQKLMYFYHLNSPNLDQKYQQELVKNNLISKEPTKVFSVALIDDSLTKASLTEKDFPQDIQKSANYNFLIKINNPTSNQMTVKLDSYFEYHLDLTGVSKEEKAKGLIDRDYLRYHPTYMEIIFPGEFDKENDNIILYPGDNYLNGRLEISSYDINEGMNTILNNQNDINDEKMYLALQIRDANNSGPAISRNEIYLVQTSIKDWRSILLDLYSR